MLDIFLTSGHHNNPVSQILYQKIWDVDAKMPWGWFNKFAFSYDVIQQAGTLLEIVSKITSSIMIISEIDFLILLLD